MRWMWTEVLLSDTIRYQYFKAWRSENAKIVLPKIFDCGHLTSVIPSQDVLFQALSVPPPHLSPPFGVLSPEPPTYLCLLLPSSQVLEFYNSQPLLDHNVLALEACSPAMMK